MTGIPAYRVRRGHEAVPVRAKAEQSDQKRGPDAGAVRAKAERSEQERGPEAATPGEWQPLSATLTAQRKTLASMSPAK
jgi:hypothetical protein